MPATSEPRRQKGIMKTGMILTTMVAILVTTAACNDIKPIGNTDNTQPATRQHPQNEETPPSKEQISAQELQNDIRYINAGIRIECPNPGLSDASWVCPQISEKQTSFMIARAMAEYIGPRGPRSKEKVILAFEKAIRGMEYGSCRPENSINLLPEILATLEHGNYMEKCSQGWNLTQPWLELRQRQKAPDHLEWQTTVRELHSDNRP